MGFKNKEIERNRGPKLVESLNQNPIHPVKTTHRRS